MKLPRNISGEELIRALKRLSYEVTRHQEVIFVPQETAQMEIYIFPSQITRR